MSFLLLIRGMTEEKSGDEVMGNELYKESKDRSQFLALEMWRADASGQPAVPKDIRTTGRRSLTAIVHVEVHILVKIQKGRWVFLVAKRG